MKKIFILLSVIFLATSFCFADEKFTPGSKASVMSRAEDGEYYIGNLYPEGFFSIYTDISCKCLKVAPAGDGYYELILRTSQPAGSSKLLGMKEDDVSLYVKKDDIVRLKFYTWAGEISGESSYLKIRITDVKPNECSFVIVGKK
ncbi:MAG: hypothetical protein MJ174_10755 [Treponema sp.]|nr:hypothetical protein [Treponema sp.]